MGEDNAGMLHEHVQVCVVTLGKGLTGICHEYTSSELSLKAYTTNMILSLDSRIVDWA